MEEQAIYHVLPDNAISVLDMFSTSKEGITLFASKVINEVEAGNIDPLKVKLYCKTLTEVADKIDQATKEHQKTAAAKYGEKPFMFAGAELHLTATSTTYDFNACKDPQLERLEKMSVELDSQIKERKEWLKKMTRPEQMVDEDELVTIYPPVKKQSMGVKVSIK